MTQQTIIIIGAGPSGLTAAYEILTNKDMNVIIYEMSSQVGGISKTVDYKGYKMDLGGHRFFSKSDIVMNWWLKFLPLQQIETDELTTLSYHNQHRNLLIEPLRNIDDSDSVMLIRQRKSRIYFLRKFFNYPLTLSTKTFFNLGIVKSFQILLSYCYAKLFPTSEENLEQFFINRFGQVLYKIFFKSYTEKVWGVDCSQISAEWGVQRIKGLSIYKAVLHIITKIFSVNSLQNKNVETSLIEQFLYPKYGPGQLWSEVANQIEKMGGKIYFRTSVQQFFLEEGKITAIKVYHTDTGQIEQVYGDYFISTMPVKDLVRGLKTNVPHEVKEISEGLIYRDFITVGLLVDKLAIKDGEQRDKLIQDNWIYIQESDVLLGRVQIFNNWSPDLVKDASKVWLGLEYFCYEHDKLWQMTNEEIAKFAICELVKIGFIQDIDVRDYTVIKVPKAYPAYFGSYSQFDQVKSYLDQFENLYLVGRNGMHRYNNQDHSMLTAMAAVENIIKGIKDKSNIWQVNTESEYHETKSEQ